VSIEVMIEPHPYLRYLAAWDRDEPAFLAALDRIAGRPVRFSGVPRPCESQAACLATFAADPVAAVTEAPDGTLLLPGNPHQVYRALLDEQYPVPATPWHDRLRLPRRRRRTPAPLAPPTRRGGLRWPDEPRVDRYRRDLFRGLVDESAAARDDAELRRSLMASPWPGKKQYALCLTYDVAAPEALDRLPAVFEETLAHDVRPAFFLAARARMWSRDGLRAVVDGGGELGLLAADLQLRGRARLKHRLQRLRKHLQALSVTGYRGLPAAPSDAQALVLAEHFRYGSSRHDTAPCPHTPLHRGCGVTTPHGRGPLQEIPITVPTGDTLGPKGYDGLDRLDLIRNKVMAVRERSGVALLALHLDVDGQRVRLQRDLLGALLAELRDMSDCWFATPGEVAAHWQRACR
jgi:hypothetical protein